jgi:beta-galactosidase
MPPKIPGNQTGNYTQNKDTDPVGSHRRDVTIPQDWPGDDVTDHFNDVISAFCLWVNGQKARDIEGNNLPVEFNITK